MAKRTNKQKRSKTKKSYFGIAKGMSPFTNEDEMKAHEF